jgi:hypothetical protein
MREVHFFDLDHTLWRMDFHAWVIDKEKPHRPIIKITAHELTMIQSGVYKKDNLPIKYNDEIYFISQVLMDKIQKKRKIPLENLGLSLIEMKSKDYIENAPLKILLNNIRHLAGQKETKIVLLTGRPRQALHDKVLNHLRLALRDIGLSFYKIYFVGQKFHSEPADIISLRKCEVLLEHLIGLKIKEGKFVSIQQDAFEKVYFYDDMLQNIYEANNIQTIFDEIFRKTEDELALKIINKRLQENLYLVTNLVGSNELNRFQTTVVKLITPAKFPLKVENKFIRGFRDFNLKY